MPATYISHAIQVTLSLRGETFDMYQPVEGGWRVRQDGLMRAEEMHGSPISYATIEEAMIRLQTVAG